MNWMQLFKIKQLLIYGKNKEELPIMLPLLRLCQLLESLYLKLTPIEEEECFRNWIKLEQNNKKIKKTMCVNTSEYRLQAMMVNQQNKKKMILIKILLLLLQVLQLLQFWLFLWRVLEYSINLENPNLKTYKILNLKNSNQIKQSLIFKN